MERVRDGRRGSASGVSVSAPRRPRITGLKDSSAGEDGDETIDDMQNPRLRERPKKDGTSYTTSQGTTSGVFVSAARHKRKRQATQEMTEQVRSSTAEDVDETTEDTEIGASDDDDDPPPPPIPRRLGKLRLQGKGSEDGISSDLPAVPRKARTAILKRPQELPSSLVVDGTSHQGSTVIPRTPMSSSAPSSSSVVSLKPGRRSKSISSSKPHAARVLKVSCENFISEQEVEVAEALYDLARMFSDPPNASAEEASLHCKAEESVLQMKPKGDCELQSDLRAMAVLSPCPPTPYSPLITGVAASFPLPLQSSVNEPSVPFAVYALEMPAIPSALTGSYAVASVLVSTSRPTVSASQASLTSPAEAPKRKRPRVKTSSDDSGSIRQHGIGIIGNSPGLIVPVRANSEHILNDASSSIVKNFVQFEATTRTSSALTGVPVIETSQLHALPTSAADCITLGPKTALLKDVVKVEVNDTCSLLENKQLKKLDPEAISTMSLPVEVVKREMELAAKNSSGMGTYYGPVLTETNNKRSNHSTSPGSEGRGLKAKELEFGLMARPSAVCSLPAAMSKTTEVLEEACKDAPRMGLVVCPASDPLGGLCKNREGDQDRGWQPEDEVLLEKREGEMEPKLHTEREQELEKERLKEEFQSCRDLSNETDVEKDQEMVEIAKQPPLQRSATLLKSESRARLKDGSSASTSLSAPTSALPAQVLGTDATNITGIVATLPSSVAVGMTRWHVGVPPIRYFSPAVTPVGWPAAATHGASTSDDEKSPLAVQLQHPYLIQACQPQAWKRCASHVYIAHYIDVQQQMNQHPFIQAAYQNSAGLYGTKPYNLNIPLSPADTLFGNPKGPLQGGLNAIDEADGCGNGLGLAMVSGKSTGAVTSRSHVQVPDKSYTELFSGKQSLQRQQQQLQSLQVGTTAAIGTVGAGPVSGGGHALVAFSLGSTTGSSTSAGGGANTESVSSQAASHAQYLQAVMQQTGFPFSFQSATHFGPGFSGPSGHQQAAQYFGGPFYATQLVHPPSRVQQQMQLSERVPGGLVSRQQPQAAQKAPCSFQPSTTPQQQGVPPSASPSCAQQQLTENPTSIQMHWPFGRDAPDSSSITDSKFSPLQRNLYSQGNLNVVVSSAVRPSSLLHGNTGMQSLPSQDLNLIATIGVKQTKQLVTSQLHPALQEQKKQQHEPQGQPAATQHLVGGPSTQVNPKDIDKQSLETYSAISTVAIKRGSMAGPGPGPLGLTPVAPVMAPQGHAMLQSMASPTRALPHHRLSQPHQSIIAQQHQQQQQQQQQRSLHLHMAAPCDIEEQKTVDGNSSRSGNEMSEDRKALAKRGIGSTSKPSRVDLETVASSHESSTCLVLTPARSCGNAGTTLNLMTQSSAVLISRSSETVQGNCVPLPDPSVTGNQNFVHSILRSKSLPGPVSPVSPQSTLSQLSFSEQLYPGPSAANKCPGLPSSISGPKLSHTNPGPRQTQVSQHHSHLKLVNRSLLVSSSTQCGIAPQSVLAGVTAKCHIGGLQEQHSRPHTHVSTSVGPISRLPSVALGCFLPTNAPLPPLPLGSKSVCSSATKGNLVSKGSFPLSPKLSSISGKRSSSHSGQYSCCILGPSPVAQNPPLQPAFLQQQNSSQHHGHIIQPLHVLSSVQQQQYQHHQAHLNSQQQTHHIQRQVLLQNSSFQPHQLSEPHVQSSHQQTSSPVTQAQQMQEYNLQSRSGSTSSDSKVISVAPTSLGFGTGTCGNINSWASCPESDISSFKPNTETSRLTGGSNTPLLSSNVQRCHTSGPPFLQSQYVSIVGSLQQATHSPRINSSSQYLQPATSSGASGKSANEKDLSAAGSPSGGKYAGSGHGESSGSQCGLMIPVIPPSLLPMSTSISSIGLACSQPDGRAFFVAASPAPLGGAMSSDVFNGSGHQSLFPVAPDSTSLSAQSAQAGFIGQTSTSTLQS